MNDDHLHDYFTARSPEISLPTVGVAAIARRARRRGRRRTAARVGAVLGVLALGGAALAQGTRAARDDGQKVTGIGTAVVESPMDWTLVTPHLGIGWSDSPVATADGAIYSLSTAPASQDDDAVQPRHLYRSADGGDWEAVALPGDLWAGAVAAQGDRLYAVGTSPAGGGVEQVEVATTDDGGGAWARGGIPLDVAALEAALGADVDVTSAHIATREGRAVVAVSLHGVLDVGALLPDEVAEDAPWEQTADGVNILADPGCEGGVPRDTVPPSASAPQGDEANDDPRAVGARDCAGEAPVPVTRPPVTHHYSWADLGLSAESAALVAGRTLLFAADGDGPFLPVGELPSGSSPLQLFAAPDGFWMVAQVASGDRTTTAAALFSADGRTWSVDGAVPLDGYPMAVGVLDGRAAVATDDNASLLLHVLEPSGTRTVDVTASLGEAYARTWPSHVAFGPLGLAATLTSEVVGAEPGTTSVLHSADGAAFSVTPIPGAEPDRREVPNGVSVTADAITVRLNSYPEGDTGGGDAVPPRQRLFVGTVR